MKKFVLGLCVTCATVGVVGVVLGLYAFIAYGYIPALIVAVLGLIVAIAEIHQYKGFKRDMPEVRRFNLEDTTIEEIEELAKNVEITDVKFTNKYLVLTYEGI